MVRGRNLNDRQVTVLQYVFSVVIQEEIVGQLPAPQYQNLIIQHMDIAEPLATLKQLLELRLQCSLSEHQFYLQDSIPVNMLHRLLSELELSSFIEWTKTSFCM